MKKNYEVWPAGKLPPKWQRPELADLRRKGYKFDDAREVVDLFEKNIAEFAGSKYAVAVDNCTDAVFLAITYRIHIQHHNPGPFIKIPSRCYMSIPMAVIRALSLNYNPTNPNDNSIYTRLLFTDFDWSGVYPIWPMGVYDSAGRFTKNMFSDLDLSDKYEFMCLSFQIKKRLPIGKGGMILTNNKEAYEWFKLARFEGRHEHENQWDDEYAMLGWNMYMTPEDAARGLLLFEEVLKKGEFNDTQDYTHYPDLSKKKIFAPYSIRL